MTAWYSTADQQRLLGAWEDAPIEDVETCGFLLETARIQVLAYAPEAATLGAAVEDVLARFGVSQHLAAVLVLLDAEPSAPPFNYVFAQLRQAQNLWNAGRVNSTGEAGMESFTFTPRPLDKTIRGIIRPTDGKPDVY
ncbi:hypothetical protein [Microbacterium oxydans]|uniref:hypothetical protein n=1 Tax=Microbacterium oxydans TaxID=82380 RepID=UPI0024ACABAE|nr:hypothetical protein [Microbacterium oxydans]